MPEGKQKESSARQPKKKKNTSKKGEAQLDTGARKLANAQPTFPSSSLHSNKQSSPSSTYSGSFGWILGCPAS